MEIIFLSQQPHRGGEIAQLLHEEWQQFTHWADPQIITSRLQQRNRPGSATFTLLALTAHGELSGTASVIEYELADDPARQFWLGEVFTVAAWRGNGIGSQLVSACIAQARRQGISALWLYTPDQQGLYQRLGWQEVEQRDVGGERVSVMVQAL